MSPATPPASVAVLDRALEWARGCVELALTAPPGTPTPCPDWDLGRLLAHLEDAARALSAAAESGHVRVLGPPEDCVTEPGSGSAPRLLQLMRRTGEAWRDRPTSAPVVIDGLVLGRDTVVLVGALEIAVHGCDVAQSVGRPCSLPDDLAEQLHAVALAVVTPRERGTRFGPAVPVPPGASAGDRLLAHLGRGCAQTRSGAPCPGRAGWSDGTDARNS